MIGLNALIFPLLWVLVWTGMLAVVRAAAPRIAARVGTGRFWWIVLLVLLAALGIGMRKAASHLLGTAGRSLDLLESLLLSVPFTTGMFLWGLVAASVELRRPGGRPWVAHLTLYGILLFHVGTVLVGQGYLTSSGLTSTFTWVVHALVGHFSLPWVELIGPDTEVARHTAALASQAADTLARHFWLPVAVGTHGLAWLSLRAIGPCPPPGARLSEPRHRLALAVLPIVAGMTLFADWSGSRGFVAPMVLAVIAAPWAIDGGRVVARLARGLRSATLLPILLAATYPFVPAVATALVALGWAESALGLTETGGTRATPWRPRLRALAGWGLGGVAALGVLASAGSTPSRTATCEATASHEGDRFVVYTTPAGARLSVEVGDRAFPDGTPPSVAAARAACRAEGLRLCDSDTFDLACRCGYEAHTSSPSALQQRIGRECFSGGPDSWRTASCDSDDGVENLLGGRVELLDGVTTGAGVVYLAGPTQVFGGGWNVFCSFRNRFTSQALETHAWPWVGFRCCGSGPRALPL